MQLCHGRDPGVIQGVAQHDVEQTDLAVKSSIWSDGRQYVWALICDQHHFILAHFCLLFL